LTAEEKCELIELLRTGKSYKQAIAAGGERYGIKVSQRSLVRWADSVVKNPRIPPEKVLLHRYHKSGRGNSHEGAFTDLLVPYLNRNFLTRNGYAYEHEWVCWNLTMIRFCLLFAVVPPNVALGRKDFVKRIGRSSDEFKKTLGVAFSIQSTDSGKPRPISRRKSIFRRNSGMKEWTGWCEARIAKRLDGKPEEKDIQDALERLADAFPLETPPFHGRLIFCVKSISKALERAGYRIKTSLFPILKRNLIWEKVD
jgi:hypothetical protein